MSSLRGSALIDPQQLRIPMRGYEINVAVAARDNASGYESPCGVMSYYFMLIHQQIMVVTNPHAGL